MPSVPSDLPRPGSSAFVLPPFADRNASIAGKSGESYYQHQQRKANKASVSTKYPIPMKKQKSPPWLPREVVAMGGFIGESQRVRNTFVHELTSVHLPGTSFWGNRGGFLTFLLFSFVWPEFSVEMQKYRTSVRYFCCVSLLSTHFGPSGETRTPGILLPNA